MYNLHLYIQKNIQKYYSCFSLIELKHDDGLFVWRENIYKT